MKSSIAVLTVLNAASLIVAQRVSYNGAKAMRISVGEDVIPLLDIITDLGLPTWKGVANGVPVANGQYVYLCLLRGVEL